jgi:hypothetical protein
MAMPGAALDSSSTSSWIGTFTRTLSGQLSSRSLSQSSEHLGVELTLRSGDSTIPGSHAASQPIDIRAPGSMPASSNGVAPDSGIIVQVAANGAVSEPGSSSSAAGGTTSSNGVTVHSVATPATALQEPAEQQQQLHKQPEQQAMTR